MTVTVLPEPSLEGATLTLAPAGATTNQIGSRRRALARGCSTRTASRSPTSPSASWPTARTRPPGTGLTDATGAATFTYTGTNVGTDTVQAGAQGSAFSVASNAVALTWTLESPTPNPSPDADADPLDDRRLDRRPRAPEHRHAASSPSRSGRT